MTRIVVSPGDVLQIEAAPFEGPPRKGTSYPVPLWPILDDCNKEIAWAISVMDAERIVDALRGSGRHANIGKPA